MEIHSQQKKRAQNVIWNASGDYTFRPVFEFYDNRGDADLYWNFIAGAVHKYYDYRQFEQFFKEVRQDPNHLFYEELTWIGLENCAYERARQDRPVLESLRRLAAEQVVSKTHPESVYYLIDELKIAHFSRVLSLEPKMREQVANILDELELDASLTTEEIIQQLRQIVDDYFPLSIPKKKASLFRPIPLIQITLPRRDKQFIKRFRNPFAEISLINIFSDGSNDPEKKQHSAGIKPIDLKKNEVWRNFQEQRNKGLRETVQCQYGDSILTESQTRMLENTLCTGHHQGCYLHFTRAESAPERSSEYKKGVYAQREKNLKYYQKHLAEINTNINRLTHIIKNAMLVHHEPSTYRTQTGQIITGRIWRNLYLDDQKIFLKTIREEPGTVSVDILLDASGSQMNRQELITSESYIIAESLDRCRIPVRISSFFTKNNFTIINLIRDYGDEHQNGGVFSYHTSGCNRDGLALRAAIHMMTKTHYDHKILIVLSDGKPLDPLGIPDDKRDLNFYSDSVGVNDAACEVMNGRQNGISILCVFSGQDEDFPAARKIYGNNLVWIKSHERFADIVGVLLKNELSSL